jgi:hypothetical protein
MQAQLDGLRLQNNQLKHYFLVRKVRWHKLAVSKNKNIAEEGYVRRGDGQR